MEYLKPIRFFRGLKRNTEQEGQDFEIERLRRVANNQINRPYDEHKFVANGAADLRENMFGDRDVKVLEGLDPKSEAVGRYRQAVWDLANNASDEVLVYFAQRDLTSLEAKRTK